MRRTNWRPVIWTTLLGGAMLVSASVVAVVLWIDLQARGVGLATDLIDPVLELAGVETDVVQGDSASLGVVFAFVGALAVAGLGAFVLFVAGVWALILSLRTPQAEAGITDARQRLDRGVSSSRDVAHRTAEASKPYVDQGAQAARRGWARAREEVDRRRSGSGRGRG